MKNSLKYLMVFEAFESEALKKTIAYLRKNTTRGKTAENKLISELKRILSEIDFPMSELSDEYIQILPYQKALELSLDEKQCKNNVYSDGKYFYCQFGELTYYDLLKREETKKPCEVCNKKKKNLKWIKIWFDKQGNIVGVTGTDGVRRKYNLTDRLIVPQYEYGLSINSLLTSDPKLGLVCGNFSISITNDVAKKADFAVILDFEKLKNANYKKRDVTSTERQKSKEEATALMTPTSIKKSNLERYSKEILDQINIDKTEDFKKNILRILGGKYLGMYILSGEETTLNLRDFEDYLGDYLNWCDESEQFKDSLEETERVIDRLMKAKKEQTLKFLRDCVEKTMSRNQRVNLQFDRLLTGWREEMVDSKRIEDTDDDYNIGQKKIPDMKTELLKAYLSVFDTVYQKLNSLKIETLQDLEEVRRIIRRIRVASRKIGCPVDKPSREFEGFSFFSGVPDDKSYPQMASIFRNFFFDLIVRRPVDDTQDANGKKYVEREFDKYIQRLEEFKEFISEI